MAGKPDRINAGRKMIHDQDVSRKAYCTSQREQIALVQGKIFSGRNTEQKQPGHSEYDADTLKKEYFRDKNLGLPIHVPENYYPDDDDTRPPLVTWRSHANLLYQNWLNYFVYQTTPYDLGSIEPVHLGRQ